MLNNQKKHSNKYKTIKEIEESSTKELTTDNKMDDEKFQFSQSYKIRNRRMLPFNRFNRSINEFAKSNKTLNSYLTYEFQSLQATKTNNLFNCITFRMNEMNMLYDTIKDIELQLKELRDLFEVSINKSKDLVIEFCHSEADLEKDLESLHKDQLKEEFTLLNTNFKKLHVENNKIRKELDDLDNFYKFGERIIINGDVRCINGVRA
ncbi:33994_t:CDS:1 [Gigaspora margarita]|uniref:33994_t:CDS:1 n=1 Tax=Gigaspora margarita TaxID=4874 RepID=A0ABN7WK39_GIGMA|nr:33994_t:CDS:1 [Gigaspora margarita]